MARFDPLDLNAEPEPPDGGFAQAVDRVRVGKWHAVIRQ
jgi:hypothetical protein